MFLTVSLEEKVAAASPVQRLDLMSHEWSSVTQSEHLNLLEILNRDLFKRLKKLKSTEVIYHKQTSSARSHAVVTVNLRWIYPAGIHDFLSCEKKTMEIRCGAHITSAK
jgi:hypothetical protein